MTRRTAMTLVEVLGGLALLAAVLGSIMAVKVRTERRARFTERRLQAIGAADSLLASWYQDPATLPEQSRGDVPADPEFVWRTQPVANAAAARLGGRVIRLDILDRQVSSDRPPLVSLEVVVPVEQKK